MRFQNTRGFIGLIALLIVFVVFLVFIFGVGRNKEGTATPIDGIAIPESAPGDTFGAGIYDAGMQSLERAKDTKTLLEQKAAQTMKEGE